LQNIFDLLQRRIWLGPLILVLALAFGLALGLLFGWVIFPVSWTPSADDVQTIADSYALNNDLNLARQRLANLPAADQARLFKKIIADSTARNRPIEAERATALAQALRVPLDSTNLPAPPAASTAPAGASAPGIPTNLLLLGGGALALLSAIAVAGFLFVRVGLPRMRAARSPIAEEPAPLAEEPAQAETSIAPPAAVPPPADSGIPGRFLASYTAGMDNFDSSYPLETPRQGFLGECGIGVSETVGDGLPDKVTAFDLWLFDKTDVRTVTQILMSDYAFNDAGVRAKLQTKGEAVRAAKDQVYTLETQSLRIEARIQDLVYATNPSLPPNSYFQKLVVELATHIKQ
jgi:hypothetical protein